MTLLSNMPPVTVKSEILQEWGRKWLVNKTFSKKESMDFGKIFDSEVGKSLAKMLGDISVVAPSNRSLLPPEANVVEVGDVRIVGGIRPQNYDVGYRPDGARFAFDSKTLNSAKSVGKNFQNLVNDLATESTTLHTRFPFAVVGFIVVIPTPCFTGNLRERYTELLERIVGRDSTSDLHYKAEALSLVLWDPETGAIDSDWPLTDSLLRIERFSEQIQEQYHHRYRGLPPHDEE